MTNRFFTIGHSTRPIDELVGLLSESEVRVVVDVRRVVRSRANPQYDAEALSTALRECQVEYTHIPALGGLRGRMRDVPAEVNAFWRNRSFHNYADYAMSAEFRAGVTELRAIGRAARCAIMCAEAVWWRCHRRIIADYLLASGGEVFHILGRGRIDRALITPGAVLGPMGTLICPNNS